MDYELIYIFFIITACMTKHLNLVIWMQVYARCWLLKKIKCTFIWRDYFNPFATFVKTFGQFLNV